MKNDQVDSATSIIYRATRSFVFEKARAVTTDAFALDFVCNFWTHFFAKEWVVLFHESGMRLETWFSHFVKLQVESQLEPDQKDRGKPLGNERPSRTETQIQRG